MTSRENVRKEGTRHTSKSGLSSNPSAHSITSYDDMLESLESMVKGASNTSSSGKSLDFDELSATLDSIIDSRFQTMTVSKKPEPTVNDYQPPTPSASQIKPLPSESSTSLKEDMKINELERQETEKLRLERERLKKEQRAADMEEAKRIQIERGKAQSFRKTATSNNVRGPLTSDNTLLQDVY
jgi:hypothetical protein